MSDIVHVIKCAGAPTAAPTREGQHYVDTTNNEMYFSVGTSSVNDWIKLEQDTDVKVKVSSNDTTSGFLNGKLVAGANITLTEQTDGGNETLEISSSAITTDEKVKVSANDTTEGYLFDKIIASSESNTTNPLEIKEVNDGFDEDLKISLDQAKIDHDQLTNYVANEHIDWTQSGAGTIHPSNYTDNDTIYTHPNHTGDVTSIGDGAQTIANNAVTNPKLADMPANTLKGNDSGVTADPKDLTPAEVRALINVEDGANDYNHPNHTGEVTSVGDGAQTLDKTAISNKTSVSPAADDYILIGDTSDLDNLKKVTAQSIADLNGGGGDTFAEIQLDGVSLSTNAPTLDFDGSDFNISEAPTDSFDITVKDSGIDHNALANYVANEHIDWTQLNAGTIHPSNYTDTVYTHPDHTGEVTSTGDGAQVVDKTAISNKTEVTAASGDYLLIGDTSDLDNLKKVTAQSIADLAAASSGPKAGAVVAGSFSGNPKKATVTFGTAYPDTNYSINLSVVATANSNSAWVPTIENKTASSFDIHLNSSKINNLVEVLWIATAYNNS